MSGSIRLIKRRIKSAKNISQITRAMEMVAASKMKRAQEKALSGKLFSQKILEMTRSLAKISDPKLHPLLKKPEGKDSILIVLISTNKGLCGSLNTNLFKKLDKFLREKAKGKEVSFNFITLGKKGQDFVLKTGDGYLADLSDQTPLREAVGPLTKLITQQFLSDKCTQVILFYNDFINALKQEPALKRILPIVSPPEKEEEKQETIKEAYLLEPSPEEILNNLLPIYLEIQIREAIWEAEASEHSARMIAMKNATDNASDLIYGLTLDYNKIRQQTITSEISDITTAKLGIKN